MGWLRHTEQGGQKPRTSRQARAPLTRFRAAHWQPTTDSPALHAHRGAQPGGTTAVLAGGKPSGSQPRLTNGMSNFHFYLRDLFGGPGLAPQFYSRETTLFNFGAPTAQWEAMSREVSLYNTNPGSGPPTSDIGQVYSREVTTWNFGSPSAPIEVVSREATLWNFGSPSANIEAISKEVSVYSAFPGSGPPTTDFTQVYSREISVFNFGAPAVIWEAISREVSVLNFDDPTPP